MALTIETLEDGRVVIPFKRQRDAYDYSDAIVLESETYNSLTEEEIIAMMDQRFENWYAYITTAATSTPSETING